MSIGNPGAYENLVGKLPEGHFDVVIPLELKDRNPSREKIKRTLYALHRLPKDLGLRFAITHDKVKHDGAFILRVIGSQQDIDSLRQQLSVINLED